MKGWVNMNFVGYMLLVKLAQHLWAGVSEEEDRERRLASPEWSRRQNYLLVPDKKDSYMSMSLSYIHPLSPVLDSMLRSFSEFVTGNPVDAIEELTMGYFFNGFLQDQIAAAAVFDALRNEDRNSGDEIVNHFTPKHKRLTSKINYVLQKAFMPPVLQSGLKAEKAGGGDYARGERKIFGVDFYSPLGEIIKHVAPLKFYPYNPEQATRRRFKEINEQLLQSLDDRYAIMQVQKSFQEPEIRPILRSEIQETFIGLQEWRRAYKIASRQLEEDQILEIMKNNRTPLWIRDLVSEGLFDMDVMEDRIAPLVDSLRDKGKEKRANLVEKIWSEELDRIGDRDLD